MTDEDFFSSSIVEESINEIIDLQNKALLFSTFGDSPSIEQQRENLEVLKDLHEKQKNMCFRCLISGNEDAKLMLMGVIGYFESFGYKVDPDNPMAVFDDVKDTLDQLEYEIIYCEMNGFFPGEEPGGETPPHQM